MKTIRVCWFFWLLVVSTLCAQRKPEPKPSPTPEPLPPNSEKIVIRTKSSEQRKLPIVVRWPKGIDQGRELLESYTYDAAGNILEQMVYGEKTQMAYDAANQLKSTETTPRHSREPIMKEFSYDKAGRMRTLSNGGQGAYGWLDKLVTLRLPDQAEATFDYHPDGHLACKKVENPNGEMIEEQLLWDGLALFRKNDQIFIIEPHASGGTPVASDGIGFLQPTFYLNDMLGTTLARVKERSFEPVPLSTFGKPIKYEQTLPRPQAMEFSANQEVSPRSP